MKRYMLVIGGLCLLLSAQDSCEPDNDDDGWTQSEGDCDDENPDIHPGLEEVCNDGIDNNCDGFGCLTGDIDLSAADAKLMGELENHQAGYSVAGAGDIDGDGLDDLLVSEPAIGSTSAPGTVYVILGSAFPDSMLLTDANAKLVGEVNGDSAGYSVAGAGDTNGDGYADVIIGAPNESSAAPAAGAAYLVLGPVAGPINLADATAKLTGENPSDYAGCSVAGAGDVNGDGYDDILVGAYGNDTGGNSAGSTYLLYGPISGDWSLAAADAKFSGSSGNELSGSAVAGAGDVDQDGYDDFLIGAYGGSRTGVAYMIYGPEAGEIDLTNFDVKFAGEASDDYAGISVAGVGDISGDGLPDVMIGASQEDTGGGSAGAAYVPFAPYEGEVSLRSADVKLTGEAASDYAGTTVSSAGDLNGDGYPDLAIGAIGDDDGGANAGAVYVVYGPVTGTVALGNASIKFVGEGDENYVGHSMASVGDINGDGYSDMLIGAYGDSTRADGAGSAYLILGEGL